MARELVAPNDIDHAGLDGSRYDHIQIAITVSPWSHIPQHDGRSEQTLLDAWTEYPRLKT